MKFLEKLKEIDPDLYEQALEELSIEDARRKESDAKGHLNTVSARYDDDLTGQDGEREIQSAVEGYIDSQNDRIKAEDPERFAEMRAMGLC